MGAFCPKVQHVVTHWSWLGAIVVYDGAQTMVERQSWLPPRMHVEALDLSGYSCTCKCIQIYSIYIYMYSYVLHTRTRTCTRLQNSIQIGCITQDGVRATLLHGRPLAMLYNACTYFSTCVTLWLNNATNLLKDVGSTKSLRSFVSHKSTHHSYDNYG